jgi:glycosyltransferase involved in cell wall biosynthesis
VPSDQHPKPFLNHFAMTLPRITILICTHNGAQTIQKVLECIADQTEIPEGIYEIVVVDNSSIDHTFQLASNTIRRLGLKGQVLSEPKVGKINAFLKGVYAAKGELVSIVDDDNFIEPGFLRYTLDIFDQYADVGITGSTNHIFVDQALPFWFVWGCGRYGCSCPWLDEIDYQDSNGVIIAQTGIVAGAGSTFRVQPLLDCLKRGYSFFNDTQRDKQMKVTGEDLELCWLMRSLGYRFAYDPRIQIRHAIKVERLNLEHFEALCRSIGAGSLGTDPFLFTHKDDRQRHSLKWSWQWQLLSKLRRYLRSVVFPDNLGHSNEECEFSNWMARVECMGAIKRILTERDHYTQHIHQVAAGQWTELRIR